MAEHTRRRNGLSTDVAWKKWVAIAGVVVVVTPAIVAVFYGFFQIDVNAQAIIKVEGDHDRDKKEEREARQLVQRAQWNAIGKVSDTVQAQAVATGRTATALESIDDRLDRIEINQDRE